MKLIKKPSDDSGDSVKLNKEGMHDAIAGRIRLGVLVIVLLVVYQIDNSAYLDQFSKWPRRTVLLLATLVLVQISSYLVIKVWTRLFRGDSFGEKL